MVWNPANEPDRIILEFLDKLPSTIRSSVLYQCCFGVEAAEFTELFTIDNLQIIREFLDEDGAAKAYRCAALAGVIEIVLEPPEGNEKTNMEIYEETGVEDFRAAAMLAPLSYRHFAVARARFAELRQTSLNPKVLSLWTDIFRNQHQGSAEE